MQRLYSHEPSVPGPSEEEHLVPVWFATNRKMDENGIYTKEQDPEMNTYGRLDFSLDMAQNHDAPKTTKDVPPFTSKKEDVFFNEIEERLGKFKALGTTEPQILVCLHNYKVGFAQSLSDAAHWQEDLNVAGAVVNYSWPSLGGAGNYNPDYAGIERSENEIKIFLLKLAARFDASKIHIVADGVACLGLIRVFQRMATDQEKVKFGQCFLLVPDIDKTLFTDLSWVFPKYTTRTTLYVSQIDSDLKRSVKRHSAPRAGLFAPLTVVDDIDTIAIKELETDYLVKERKTYSYEIASLFNDMYDLMKSNTPPSRRLHLAKEEHNDKAYWSLRKLHGKRHYIPLPF